jgi:hypothetical protein
VIRAGRLIQLVNILSLILPKANITYFGAASDAQRAKSAAWATIRTAVFCGSFADKIETHDKEAA